MFCFAGMNPQAVDAIGRRWTCFRIPTNLWADLGIYVVPRVWRAVRQESWAHANYWSVFLMEFSVFVWDIPFQQVKSAWEVTDGPELGAGIC